MFSFPSEVRGDCTVSIEVTPNSDIKATEIKVTATNISSNNTGPFYFESDDKYLVGRKKEVKVNNGTATFTYFKNKNPHEFSTNSNTDPNHKINFLDGGTPICNNTYIISPYRCTLKLTKNGLDITNKQIPWNQRHGEIRATVDQQSQLNLVKMKVPDKPNLITRDLFGNLGLEANSPAGQYTVFFEGKDVATKNTQSICSASFYVLGADEEPDPNWQQGKGANGTPAEPCSSIDKETNPTEFNKCNTCLEGKDDKGNILPYGPGSWSALGCIPTYPDKFIQWLLDKAINIVGGIAFLLILFGSFKVATSSGNPESLNEGKDIIFAALAGLLFIVFSVILLKIIGSDILQIPGFQ